MSARSQKSARSGRSGSSIKAWKKNPLKLTVIKDDMNRSDISEEYEEAFEELAALDLVRGADPTQNHLTGTIAE